MIRFLGHKSSDPVATGCGFHEGFRLGRRVNDNRFDGAAACAFAALGENGDGDLHRVVVNVRVESFLGQADCRERVGVEVRKGFLTFGQIVSGGFHVVEQGAALHVVNDGLRLLRFLGGFGGVGFVCHDLKSFNVSHQKRNCWAVTGFRVSLVFVGCKP